MPGGSDSRAIPNGGSIRLAWLLACLIPLVVLLGILLVAKPADEAAATPPPAGVAAEAEGEEPEEEPEDEGEYEEWEEEEAEAESFPECLLRSTHAHAVQRDQKLKLTVGYTAYEPVDARVEIRSGRVQIGSVQRHLGRSGVLRITRKLGKDQRAERLTVNFRIAGAPASCGRESVRVR